jgi:hypothetical protein
MQERSRQEKGGLERETQERMRQEVIQGSKR